MTTRAESLSPLQVGILTEKYYPHIAGAERQLQTLVPKLRQRGIEAVILTRQEDRLPARDLIAGGAVYRLSAARGRGRIQGSLAYTLTAFRFLARHRARIGVAHAHGLFSPATTAVLAKLLLGKPAVVKLLVGGPTGDLAVLHNVRSGRLRGWLLARLVDRFVAVSAQIEQELLARGVPKRRIARIPNGVDTERFRPASLERRDALRKELGLTEGPVALFVGRLSAEKGLRGLLEAWNLVRWTLPTAWLVLAGDGPLRPALEARAEPGVRFVGWVAEPLPYLQAADCFVLPSTSEGLSNALLEAMATGLPCVATATVGAELLRSGVEGWLVPPDSIPALADAILSALSDPRRSSIGQAARDRAIRDFSIERTADQLAKLYRELAGSRTRNAEGP